MNEQNDIQQAMSHLHASATTLWEVYNKMENKKTYKRFSRRLAIVTAAVILTLALGITASAAGFSSLFSQVPWNAVSDQRTDDFYTQAAEHSDKTPQHSTLSDGSFFTINESYYDGENLLLAYSLEETRHPVSYAFDSTHEFFKELTMVSADYQFLWYQDLSEQEYTDIMNRLNEYGQVGVILTQTYLSDKIKLQDGTDIGPFVGGPLSADENVIYMEPQNGLSESAKNLDSLIISCRLKTTKGRFLLFSVGS